MSRRSSELEPIPFNRPETAGAELAYVQSAIASGQLAGNGEFTSRCAGWLEQRLGCARALMTPSCSAGLDMATRLAGVGHGDEVIMPSFTFVSTASAAVRAGATPVFVDVDAGTLNIDPAAAAAAVGPRTKAIVVVHYAGVACDMEALGELAREHGLALIEDAAHAIGACWRQRPLGSIGDLAALSFHDTKNLHCGEGGALLVNDGALVAAAERMHDRGTNRAQFRRGEVDAYTWIGEGSNYLMSELSAAFLWGQLEQADAVTAKRRALWSRYFAGFAELEARGLARRPVVPEDYEHNGHIFYLLLDDRAERDALIVALAAAGIQAVFHYIPLHSSPAGRRFGRACGDLSATDSVAERIVRLPLSPALGETGADRVIDAVYAALGARAGRPLAA
jgi:dTDP-4-amino-4,6-dideoxygalactose transaminase